MAERTEVRLRTSTTKRKIAVHEKKKESVPMNADALRLRETSKRRVSQEELARALAALRSIQFSNGKRTDSVKILRNLRS